MANFEFLKGNIEVIILNSLYQKDRYGYEIAKEVKEKTESAYEIKQPTLYSYLKRLEAGGLITSYWGEESSGGRRRYYRLTAEGKTQCESFLSEWKYQKNVIDSLVSEEINVEEMTQSEATPLLGSKIKRQKRETKNVSLKEQQNLSTLLEQLTLTKQGSKPTAQKGGQDMQQDGEHGSKELFESQTLDAVRMTQTLFSLSEQKAADSYEAASGIIYKKEHNYDKDKTAEGGKKGFFDFLRSNKKSKKERGSVQTRKNTTTDYSERTSKGQSPTQEEGFLSNAPYFDDGAEQALQAYESDNNVSKRDKEDFFDEFNKKAQQIIERNKSVDIPDAQLMTAQKDEREAEGEKNYKYVLGSALEKQLAGIESLSITSAKESKTVSAPQNDEPTTLEGLVDNFALQGVKVRLYNKATSSYVPQAMLYKNKINLIASWLTYITFAFVTLLIWLAFKDLLSITYAISFVVLPLLFPLIFTVLFFINPAKKIAPKFDFKYHLVNTVIAFALITLLVFTLFMLFGGVFDNKEAVLAYIVLPVIAAVSIPLYVLYYKLFFKKALI